jgi:two-component system sensor histidine kinase DesK
MKRQWRVLPVNKALGWTPYAWLIYLPTFLMDPITEMRAGPGHTVELIVAVIASIAFLVSYFYGFWVRGNKLAAVVAFQTVLGVVFAPFNIGSFVFFIYAGSFAAQLHDRPALLYILGIAAIAALTALWVQPPPFFWIGGIVITLLVGAVNYHFARFGRTQQQLKLAEKEVQHMAAVAERERIARDLHDVLGHTLSLIVLKSELASKLATRDPQRAAQEIGDVENVARKALQEVRETIRGIRPSLSEELERAQSLLKAAGVMSEVEQGPLNIDKAREETLAFLVREAATNVARHAQAAHCRISVAQRNGTASLVVQDDGAGKGVVEGSGMRGMRERVEALGGVMRYTVSKGMTLHIDLPASS